MWCFVSAIWCCYPAWIAPCGINKVVNLTLNDLFNRQSNSDHKIKNCYSHLCVVTWLSGRIWFVQHHLLVYIFLKICKKKKKKKKVNESTVKSREQRTKFLLTRSRTSLIKLIDSFLILGIDGRQCKDCGFCVDMRSPLVIYSTCMNRGVGLNWHWCRSRRCSSV